MPTATAIARPDHTFNVECGCSKVTPGPVPANSAAVDQVIQALFQRQAQLFCASYNKEDAKHQKTWIFLDEMRFHATLPTLPELICFNRYGREEELTDGDVDAASTLRDVVP